MPPIRRSARLLSLGARLARNQITGVAIGGRAQLVTSILNWYEYRAKRDGELEEAMANLENDMCLLVGFRCDLMNENKTKALRLWDDVAALTLTTPTLTRELLYSTLMKFREKELFALLGIAVQPVVTQPCNMFGDGSS